MSVEVGESRAIERDEAETDVRSRLLPRLLTDARLLLIALWLGGAVFFSAAVAPSVFGVLRGAGLAQANHLAGAIVTRTLSIINVGGLFISLVLMATAFLFRERAKRRAFVTEVIALTIVAVATAIGHWGIAARMVALRRAMGRPIDDVPVGDSLRAAFGTLHGLSVMALSVAMIAALVVLFLIARRKD